MLGLKGMAITGGAAFLVGSIGGGIAMNKLWLGKQAKQQVAELTDALELQTKHLAAERGLRESSQAESKRLSDLLEKRELKIDSLIDQNAEIARRQPKDTVRIIEKGEEIGTQLENDYAWIRYSWPSELRDYANGKDRKQPDSMPLAGPRGYPEIEDGFIP